MISSPAGIAEEDDSRRLGSSSFETASLLDMDTPPLPGEPSDCRCMFGGAGGEGGTESESASVFGATNGGFCRGIGISVNY